MNCPICNLELKEHTSYSGLFTCSTQILTGISHYEKIIYKDLQKNTLEIKHSLYMSPMNLVWWEDEAVVKVRPIGDFRPLAHEKVSSLEDVVRIGNRYRNLSAFL